jgi:hypothetical protein
LFDSLPGDTPLKQMLGLTAESERSLLTPNVVELKLVPAIVAPNAPAYSARESLWLWLEGPS